MGYQGKHIKGQSANTSCGQGRHVQVKRPRKGRIALEWFLTIAAAVIIGLVCRAFLISIYFVPTGSMESTIMTDDKVLAEKITYRTSEPQYGDVVVFEDPSDPDRDLIKRCIATSGQTVNLVNGNVYVDGILLDEPYTNGLPSYSLNDDIVFPYVVPQGFIWVMGDNRTDSKDSRYFGAVSVDSVEARALRIVWPISRWGKL